MSIKPNATIPPLPLDDLKTVGFESGGGWVVFDEEVTVGPFGTDGLFHFMVE